MSLKIQNTLTAKKEKFIPRDKDKVSMYVCGPTVYNFIHIGNARAYIAFDVIHRYLEYRGYDVTYVRNLTDVDDKIIKKANEDKVSVSDVTTKFTKAFHNDMELLGVKPPEVEPKATETIPDMIKMIEGLIDKGFAYEVDGDVYYRVKAFKGYGKLSKRSLEEMVSGARVEIDDRKEDPMDFALWKKAKEGEPSWESPWGNGRPGWHIECSAMSLKYLGEGFDIHGGGQDLIFPHHENEIAQSEGFTGNNFVKYWLHNGFVNIEQEKMAKSVGNVILIKDLEERYAGNLDAMRNDVRMLFLMNNYHGPINFSYKKLDESRAAVERIEDTLIRIKFYNQRAPEDEKDQSKEFEKIIVNFSQKFEEDMDDDFNTPQAISRIFDLVKEINVFLDKKKKLNNNERKMLINVQEAILSFSSLLGFNFEAKIWFDSEKIASAYAKVTGEKPPKQDTASILTLLVNKREEARKQKDYAVADKVREILEQSDLIIEDTPFGARISKK